ncbi:flavin monoamine oxidase family protein [Naasia lichenicola]|uniref:FAD-dependent oxidoreductase n=1 Tax=Naasia lichenicola TaxID=2565933 RepID=A0A4S4FS13_9MICO|nr:NAD(P)/FAD-dependent oxidoreductase [Naasia lichenicola]THG33490.1 FAD-dependent oxidoreductase [Naasia lichenicola]
MSFSRRTFLAGAAAGFSVLVLTACEPDRVTPPPTTSAPLPSTTPTAVPIPADILRSAWADDPFSRGTHSFLATGSSPDQRIALRQAIDGRLFFAGEATDDDAPGTVTGAIASGARAANQADASSLPSDRIAIVGAGASGASAAAVLAAAGYDVTVIEARDRIGGRIHSTAPDGWPVGVELGAGRFASDQDADVIRSVGDGVAPLSSPPALFTPTGETAEDRDAGASAIASAAQWAADRPEDLGLGDALDGSGAGNLAPGDPPAPIDYLTAELRRRITDSVGAEPADLSSWYGLDTLPPAADTVALGGVSELVTELLGSSAVWLSTAVLSISRTDDAVSLRLGTGESVTFDRVILTVPLGVLKAQAIEIEPPLPFDQRAAIAELGFGDVESVWVRFDEAFWSTDAVQWSVLGSDFIVTDWVNLMPITGSPVLIGLVGGEAASSMSALSDGELSDALMTALAPFVGA